ncbi:MULTISPECIES: hypothetical protein [Pseudomonas]|uniref:hypothetical protein n=1 Tax=Pseudomonas TaxID=286 RepID=UPI0030022F6F
MQSNQLPAARAELEREITSALSALINDFKARSGIGVGAIDVNFVDTRSISDPCEVKIISHVNVGLSL